MPVMKMIAANDLLTAAHARSLGFALVTNNTAEFGRVRGLTIENWTLPLVVRARKSMTRCERAVPRDAAYADHARSATGLQVAARERDLIIEERSSRLRWEYGSEPAPPRRPGPNHCAKSRVGRVLAPACAPTCEDCGHGHG
jgi:hypothetical protein